MLTITKEFTFHAAHRLYNPTLTEDKNRAIYGKCSGLHGHSYRLQVSVTGPLNENGMVIDFNDLHEIVKTSVIDRYEHCYLNDLDEYLEKVPTVEHMAEFIFNTLQDCLSAESLKVNKITLYETATSWATRYADA